MQAGSICRRDSAARGLQVCHCETQRGRGALSAKREEVPLGCNLGKAVAISPMTSLLSGRVLRDCHVASLLAMTNLGALCGRQSRSITCQPARRSGSAAADAIGACHFNDALYESAVYRRERHAAPLQRSVGSFANYQLSTFHLPPAGSRYNLSYGCISRNSPGVRPVSLRNALAKAVEDGKPHSAEMRRTVSSVPRSRTLAFASRRRTMRA